MRKNVILMALICLLFVFQAAFAQIDPDPYNRPQAKENLVYNGFYMDLYQKGTSLLDGESYTFHYRQYGSSKWVEDEVLQAKYPGFYTIEWVAVPEGGKIEDQPVKSIGVEIDQKEAPQAREGLVYDPEKPDDQQYLIDPEHFGYVIGTDRYYWRYSDNEEWRPLTQMNQPVGVKPGTYKIKYILWSQDTPEKERQGFELTATISGKEEPVQTPTPTPTPRPQPGPQPRPDRDPSGHVPFYFIGDGSDLFTEGLNLPATGFPTRFNKPLSVQPENISYESLAIRIQIPVIDVDVELTGVPEINDTWAVEWLADRAGLLSRSAMPGEGYAMVAAHNHLNAEEIGPFALLFSLEENDRIFVNTPDGGLQIYSVYANKLLEPDDVKAMESIAREEENSLILVTCENEMIDGGYMNRRTIFAKPVASL